MSLFILPSPNTKAQANQLAYVAGTSSVSAAKILASLPMLGVKVKGANSVRVLAMLPKPTVRLVGADVGVIKASLPVPTVKLRAAQPALTEKPFRLDPAKPPVKARPIVYKAEKMVGLRVFETLPRIEAHIRGGQPTSINIRSALPMPQVKFRGDVPFGVKADIGFAKMALDAKLFMPPFQLTATPGFGKLSLDTLIAVPSRVMGKIGFQRMAMTTALRMDSYFDGYVGFQPMTVSGEAYIAPYIDATIGFPAMEVLGEANLGAPSIDAAINFGAMSMSATLEWVIEDFEVTGELGFRPMSLYGRMLQRNPSTGGGGFFAYNPRKRRVFINFGG